MAWGVTGEVEGVVGDDLFALLVSKSVSMSIGFEFLASYTHKFNVFSPSLSTTLLCNMLLSFKKTVTSATSKECFKV